MDSEILVPYREGGPGVTPGKSRLDFVTRFVGGYEAIVAYSSADTMQAHRRRFPSLDNFQLTKLRGKEVFELVRDIAPGMGLYLNPETSLVVSFPPSVVNAMAGGGSLDPGKIIELNVGEQLHIGQPATYPNRLVDALTALFRRSGAVGRAYLAQVYTPARNDPPHVVIGIQLVANSPQKFPSLTLEMGAVAQKVLESGEFVDFMEIDHDPLSKYMTDETKPFYRRE